MQDGIEFYHKKLFSKAQECFIDELKNLNEDSDRYCEVLEYLIEISKKINNKDIKVYYSKIIEFHFKKSNYTKIIKYSKQELELKAEILTIKAMYFLGMLEEFEQRTKKILETCLEEKLHSYTEELCTWLKDKKKYSLMPLFAELMVAVEVNHNSKVVEVTNFIEKLILEDWNKLSNKKKSQKEYFNQLINLLDCIQEKDFNVTKKILELKIKVASIEGKRTFSKEELIEAIIIFSNEVKTLALLSFQIEDQFIRLDFKSHILSRGVIKKKDILFCHEDIKNFFNKRTRVIRTEPVKPSFEVVGDTKKPLSISLEEKDNIYKKYLEDNSDDQIFSIEANAIIKHDPEAYKEPYSLVVSLINLKLYDSGLKLLEKMEMTKASLYIKAQILYFKEQYAESIEIINELLNKENNENEYVSCLYLKAINYEKLGKKSEAQNQYSIIATLDPNYRNVKERLIG